MERRAETRAGGHRDREGEAFLQSARETAIAEGAAHRLEELPKVRGIVRQQAKHDGDVAPVVEHPDVGEERHDVRCCARVVHRRERGHTLQRVRHDVHRVRDPDHERRFVPDGVARQSLQLPGCSVRLHSVLARVGAAHHRGDHFLLRP